MYSPHIGQSQSVDLSMHLCELSIEVGIHALHIYDRVLMAENRMRKQIAELTLQ